jgi:hypothetical protein
MLSAYSSDRARHNVAGYVVLGAVRPTSPRIWPSIRPYRSGRLHGYGLGNGGPISPTDAVNTVFPQSQVRGTAGFTQDDWNLMFQSVQQLQIVGLPAAQCAGQEIGAANDLTLTKTAGGMALTGISIGAAIAGPGAALAAPTLGISIAVASLVGIFSTIFAHHAAAVAHERQVECAAVPAANNYLKIIVQAVQSGQETPQQGIRALASLVSDFESTISSIVHRGGSSCNAGCRWEKSLEAIAAYLTSQFQQMPPAAPAAPASGAASSAPTPAATPAGTLVLPGAASSAPTIAGFSFAQIAALVIGGIVLSKIL